MNKFLSNFYFFPTNKMVFLHIVLRGISGVGKTTLRNRLVDFFRARDVAVVVFSKDNIRKEIKRLMGIPQYTYTPEQELICRKIYHSRLYNFLKKPCGRFADPSTLVVVISDCTNCSLEALTDSCFYWNDSDHDENAKFAFLDRKSGQRIFQILIEVGNWVSESRASRPLTNKTILMRQGLQLIDSHDIVIEWAFEKRAHLIFYFQPHSAIENPEDVREIGELLLHKFLSFRTK